MSMPQFPYPPAPLNVPASVTQPSLAFKKEVGKVMFSIVMFFVVYILMILLSLALAAACVYGGLMLILAFPRFITLIIGAGIVMLGILVFIFLIKFIFATYKQDNTGLTRITKDEHPQLFEFVNKLVVETGTRSPKKIFLTTDVNAAVTYNSSFWSMLLPIRKNLIIGLGLVNVLNISEFKAVVAHEFGHFSQRSMKLGSFVYNVNRVIYNMLFSNTNYTSFLEGFASIHGAFAFFAQLTAYIVVGIQVVLHKMYGFINKNYLGLSKQMEYHADAIAASVAGSNQLINALRRVEMGQNCFQMTLERINEGLSKNEKSANVFANQRAIMHLLGEEEQMPFENQLPVVSTEFYARQATSRINYKDQWASHPTQQERESHLNAIGLVTATDDTSAWVLLQNALGLQQQFTNSIYEEAKQTAENVVENSAFENAFRKERQKYHLPKIFKGWYDYRFPALLGDADKLANNAQGYAELTDLDIILNEQTLSVPFKIKQLTEDIKILEAIAAGNTGIKSFDLAGIKYEEADASNLKEQLDIELKQLKAAMEEQDKALQQAYSLVAKKAGQEKEFEEHFQTLYKNQQQVEAFTQMQEQLLQVIQKFYSEEGLGVDAAEFIIDEMKTKLEPKIKESLKQYIIDGLYDEDASAKSLATKYSESNFAYFTKHKLHEKELQEFWAAVIKTLDLLQSQRQLCLKQTLEYIASHFQSKQHFKQPATETAVAA